MKKKFTPPQFFFSFFLNSTLPHRWAQSSWLGPIWGGSAPSIHHFLACRWSQGSILTISMWNVTWKTMKVWLKWTHRLIQYKAASNNAMYHSPLEVHSLKADVHMYSTVLGTHAANPCFHLRNVQHESEQAILEYFCTQVPPPWCGHNS